MENSKFVQDLQNQVYHFNMYNNFSNIVILCVGTNKLIGDSVGPMVGQQLSKMLKGKSGNKNVVIYGNMEQTLNFKNAKQVIESVFKIYEKPFMITIDAALGNEEMIQKIVVNKGKMQIGNSLGREICYDSHINIKGVVGEYKDNPKENIETLMRVDKEAVKQLSNKITYGICEMLETINFV